MPKVILNRTFGATVRARRDNRRNTAAVDRTLMLPAATSVVPGLMADAITLGRFINSSCPLHVRG